MWDVHSFFWAGWTFTSPTFFLEDQQNWQFFSTLHLWLPVFFCTWSSSWVTRPFLVSCVPVGVMIPTKQGWTPKANLVGGRPGVIRSHGPMGRWGPIKMTLQQFLTIVSFSFIFTIRNRMPTKILKPIIHGFCRWMVKIVSVVLFL